MEQNKTQQLKYFKTKVKAKTFSYPTPHKTKKKVYNKHLAKQYNTKKSLWLD